jgi:hypothetical protein
MKVNKNPRLRRDLEFFPIRQGNSQFVLVRDPLGLVEEGKAVPWPLYEFMILLDQSTRSAVSFAAVGFTTMKETQK